VPHPRRPGSSTRRGTRRDSVPRRRVGAFSHDRYHSSVGRRLLSVPVLFVIAVSLLVLIPVWLILGSLVDLVGRRFRLPTVRLLSFALLWSWFETLGVLASFGFWLVGGARRAGWNYGLQRWWAARLMWALRTTCGIVVTVENPDALSPGPTVLLGRHASLADSLVSAWVITSERVKPRYVLKKELLVDPCLDIVGRRVPNHFLDRGAADSGPELAALENLAAGLDSGSTGVIFPEGTRANPTKRRRALEKLAEVAPQRAERLEGLRHLLPPRPAGAAAMLRGRSDADVVLAWHVGFEGLDTFGGIRAALARPSRPVRFVMRRVPRSTVPSPSADNMEAFVEWLDEQWSRMDDEVDRALAG